MMKRKGGLQPGDQRKLIKFNWMPPLQIQMYAFQISEIKTKSGTL